MKKVKVGSRVITGGQPTFIIAEAGVNHNGDFNKAYKMVDIASKAGADAVTFQHIIGEKLNSNEVQSKLTVADWKKWELSDVQLNSLCKHAKEQGLQCSICVIDEESLDKVIKMGISFIKIVSGDLTNIPFLKCCAKTKLPLFMSTGGSTLGEIKNAISAIEDEGGSLVLYHTNSSYPTPPSDVNLKILETLEENFEWPLGFCDHTVEVLTPAIAVAKGALVLEKHFTLDRSIKAPDWEVSLEPDELAEMIEKVRFVETILGNKKRRVLESEKDTIKLARRSITAKVPIPKGSRIKNTDLVLKRPGTGIKPESMDLIVGKIAKIDIEENDIIKEGDISD